MRAFEVLKGRFSYDQRSAPSLSAVRRAAGTVPLLHNRRSRSARCPLLFDGFLQPFLDLGLRLSEDILDDGFSGFGIVADSVPSLPAPIFPFSDIPLTICLSLWLRKSFY